MSEKAPAFDIGVEPVLARVFSAVLTHETLHEALAELVAHGRVMLTVTQPVYVTGNNLSSSGNATIGVVKDYFANEPEGKNDGQ